MWMSNNPDDYQWGPAVDRQPADQKVVDWIVKEFQLGHLEIAMLEVQRNVEHLRACENVTVTFDAYESTYGCETGCDYARLEADLSCPHDAQVSVEYGAWGALEDLLADDIGWEMASSW